MCKELFTLNLLLFLIMLLRLLLSKVTSNLISRFHGHVFGISFDLLVAFNIIECP